MLITPGSAFGWAEMLPLWRYQRNMEVNFFGTVRLTQAFLPMIRASKGRVVNIGSIGARMPSSFGSAYLSTKSAMVSYSECVRQEVKRMGESRSHHDLLPRLPRHRHDHDSDPYLPLEHAGLSFWRAGDHGRARLF